MRIFYDTNVILDLLANRPGFADDAEKAIDCASHDGNRGLVSALTVCDIVYILRKSMPRDEVGRQIKALQDVLEIIDVTGKSVIDAFDVSVSDYEDTVQYLNATTAKADVIVTRDKDGFAGADIRVCTSREFLENA